MSRRSIVVIDDFYRDPHMVREYALTQPYYTPYEDAAEVLAGRTRPTWWATPFRLTGDCPFKRSPELLKTLESAVDEPIDREFWCAPFPVDAQSKPIVRSGAPASTCLWNCCFHVKPDNGQRLGQGVHNHVTDGWNSVGANGWAGIIYLNPAAPTEGGLHIWQNMDRAHNFDWMTSAANWQLTDSFANQYNRLILVRGDLPHSGARGWGDSIETGRMYQTFFFRTLAAPTPWSAVDVPEAAH